MERPQWAAIRSVMDDLQQSMQRVGEIRQQMLEVTGTAWSDDRLIKAVVGTRGQLIELDIDPRIYRTPNSKALSASIVATVRAAVDEANRKAREIMEQALPRGRELGLLGKTDFDVMLEHHDADLPQAMKKNDEERGHGYIS